MIDEKLNIVIIDYQQIIREGIKRVIETHSPYQVLVSSDHYSVLKTVLPYEQIDVLLIDIHIMLNNKDKIKADLKQYPQTKLIVLATEREREYVVEAINYGIDGFMLKEMNIYTFIEAIQIVTNGKSYIHPTATEHLVDEYRTLKTGKKEEEEKAVNRPLHLYTRRECEVLQLLANGKSNRDIARALAISEKTVKNHISSLFRKMKVNDRTHAVVTAIRNNWVQL